MPTMTGGSWFLRRTIPFTLVTAAVAAALGLLRARLCFLAGLQGMFIGGLLGYVFGRWVGDREQASFARRLRLCLGSAFLFMLTQTVVVSELHAGSGGCFDWLTGVVDGYRHEPFFSAGGTRATLRTVSGSLGGWSWVVFSILDFLLYASGNLIGFGIGLPAPGEGQGERG